MNITLDSKAVTARTNEKLYICFFKRLIDIVLSLTGIILLAIPMLITAIIIKIDSPGPVLFKQKRIGIHKTTFNIYKFRSMPVDVPHDLPTHLFTSNASLTKFQRFERRYSIDELPQLFCILFNKMSIVGPRPALWNQYDLIEERERFGANDVMPGLTGFAQINGRDEIDISEKAKLDGEYAAVMQAGSINAFAMDFRCFLCTIKVVLHHDGVVEKNSAPAVEKDAEEIEDEQEKRIYQ